MDRKRAPWQWSRETSRALPTPRTFHDRQCDARPGTCAMIHVHSLGRAARYFPERPAVSSGATRLTFGELHGRVARVAATLSRLGFAAGDRLALLLPNEVEYLEFVYACAWLGVIAVPLNTRFSSGEIDRVLADAGPRGLIRHSALPAPTVQVSWQRVLDKEPLEPQSGA